MQLKRARLHRPRVTVTTENFHVKTRFCRSSGHHYCYDSRYRLVLPEKHAELVLEKKREIGRAHV